MWLGIGLLLTAIFLVFYSYPLNTTILAEDISTEAVVSAVQPDTITATTTSIPVSDVPQEEEDTANPSPASLAGEMSLSHSVSSTSDDVQSSTINDRTIVPFYSQFDDITPVAWRKIGCGIASLAMLIDYYKPTVNVDTLLEEGIANGAYIENAGWSHAGLINLAQSYGLSGAAHSYAYLGMTDAFATLESAVAAGPVMVSVHYTFDPTNPIPHLVVITGVHDGRVYYNDPAEASGDRSISIEQFQSSWKKRHIEIRA